MDAEKWYFDRYSESHLKLEGEFLGFSHNTESERKYLRVAVNDREIELKLSKELRHIIAENWTRGDLLQVFAKSKNKGKVDRPKLKVYHVDRLSCTLHCSENLEKLPCHRSSQDKLGKIEICQKSGCLKRGGKNLYRDLERVLSALELQDRVKIEITGCQKRCKKAPNMVLMPGNRRCSQMSESSLYLLLKEHYAR